MISQNGQDHKHKSPRCTFTDDLTPEVCVQQLKKQIVEMLKYFLCKSNV